MRVNPKVFTERTDMLSGIQIPNCQPKELKVVAERIMNMVTTLGYSVGDYNTVTELDKLLTVDYWKTYDEILNNLVHGDSYNDFKLWYLKATEPELISRARRWLVERNYLLLKSDVSERAHESARKFSSAVKGGK
jgi:hypothetical protein